MTGISLIVIKNGSQAGEDITGLVQKIVWSGRKGSAARSLKVSIIDDDGYKHSRITIEAEQGYQCLFSYKGAELFRGLIMSTTQTEKKIMTFLAYDYGISLANNEDTFVYENKTASEIFSDICSRFSLPVSSVSPCTYRIPNLTKRKTTAWDTIANALSIDYDATGIRHYVVAEKGKLKLITRKENILQWVIETGVNLSGYTYENSIEDIRTRVKMVSDKDTVVNEQADNELESKIGIFQEIQTPGEKLNAAQIQELCTSILKEKSRPKKSLSLNDVIGIPEVISGVGVFVIIPHLGLSRSFYVDSDTHNFEDNKHTMSLTLNYTNDI